MTFHNCRAAGLLSDEFGVDVTAKAVRRKLEKLRHKHQPEMANVTSACKP